MKVQWSFGASEDLRKLTEYIGERNPRAAELDLLLSEAASKLTDFPMSGRVGGTREILPHRHYRLVYSTVVGTIRIEAVVHNSRQRPPVDENGS